MFKKSNVYYFFSYHGFHLIEVKGEDYNFNSNYACLLIDKLKGNVNWFYPFVGATGMMLHWDNASSHKSLITRNKIESVGFIEVEHPPYSPDIAPCDFFLFGYIKNKLKGNVFNTSNELKVAIEKVVMGISTNTIQNVFLEWKIRLDTVINNGGEYFL